MKKLTSVLLTVAVTTGGFATAASATDYAIYVAGKDSPAQSVAKGKANGTNIFSERTLHKALNKASELLGQPGAHSVRVLVAGGRYDGKAGEGVWRIPTVDNPQGRLYVLGGLNDDFTGRQPFNFLTELVTAPGRDGALMQFGKKSQLKEAVISGFIFDAAPSNSYDAKTNSILKGTSRSYPLMSFALLITDKLTIADNVFLNGAHGAFDTMITPMSADATVEVSNNFFINNIKTLKTGTTVTRKGNSVKAVNFRHNSFLVNWPFNPDSTSSNVSAVELYHSGGAKNVSFENNIFALNPGGAMQHDNPENAMPKLTLNNNLFWMNATLFGNAEGDAGVFAGKFGLNPKYLVLDLETIEDDFDYMLNGNVSFDPKIPLQMAPLKSVDNASINRQNTVTNDVRRILGMNQNGGTVEIANYAPLIKYDRTALPFPLEERAKSYGVQPESLWKFGK